MRALGADAFRLSLEWGRLVPKRSADPAHLQPSDLDPAVVAHYHAVFASLAAHGLTPIVTLVHYSLPVRMDNPAAYDSQSMTISDGSFGGWTSPQTAVAFASYAGLMAQTFGSEVTWWLTENEPNQVLLGGYTFGVIPPGFSNLSLTDKKLPGGVGFSDVLRNMIAGHALAYKAIKAAEPTAKISFAHNSIAFEPLTSGEADVAATARLDHLYNLQFLDAVTAGAYDTSLVGAGPVEQARADVVEVCRSGSNVDPVARGERERHLCARCIQGALACAATRRARSGPTAVSRCSQTVASGRRTIRRTSRGCRCTPSWTYIGRSQRPGRWAMIWSLDMSPKATAPELD